MPSRRVETGPTGSTVRDRIRTIRDSQGLSLTDVCRRLADLGRPLRITALSDIENGARRVDVDDLVALAATLGVSPLTLLMPETSQAVRRPESERAVAAQQLVESTANPGEPVTADRYWQWLRTEYPLTGDPVRAMDNLEFQRRAKPSWHLFEVNLRKEGTARDLRTRAAELMVLADALEAQSDGND